MYINCNIIHGLLLLISELWIEYFAQSMVSHKKGPLTKENIFETRKGKLHHLFHFITDQTSLR